MTPAPNAAQKGKALEITGAPARVSHPEPSRPTRPYPPAARTINVIFSVNPAAARRQESFSEERVQPLGFISLPISFCDDNGYTMSMVNFTIIRAKSGYNAILGRTTLNSFGMVISTPHLCVKFPTSSGVVTIKGDVRQAARYFQIAAQLVVDQLDPRESQPVVPQEGVINVTLGGGGDSSKIVNISSFMNDKQQAEITVLLSEYINVFAWTPEDILGVDRAVCEHHLNISPNATPIKQKKRVMAGERQIAIEEVNKLLRAGYIKEVQYPQWLTNVVMVKKANGKWRMCVDFHTLNQACPKDTYPLPCIEAMVDRTFGYEVMSFLDAFSGYHQIRMAKEDEEKTAFITDLGTYCYNVMPFGLKNAGATYQRMIDVVFKDQRGKNLEAYVDDILVKSKSMEGHLTDLMETLDTLRRFNLKLNPAKCTFGAVSGKFLGYLISARGIEINPDKISAILSMPSPRMVKQIHKLAGQINDLGRFISKAGDRCSPFFRCLRNNKKGQWTNECEAAFIELKRYLTSPSILVVPKEGAILSLYLGVSDTVVSTVLVNDDSGVQHPMFYISHILLDAESRYLILESLALALLMMARKLRPYFQSCTIQVVTDQPLLKILHTPEVSGRLLKWSIELGEYDIKYVPRTAIKAQALADFVAELSTSEPSPTKSKATPWSLHIDGASRSQS
ncbi:RNA-directed DNA polymerase like [Apostasia shenzhenica]|uniref:RNA-directed DNA polymerase like n=1 Tax=Apostasia shenzhenica TaxID=1088818 RepID=A0A2I0AQN0_9ASPA|nr:RNA-directed DNA polymerase like [Apostasia shenzhenica]